MDTLMEFEVPHNFIGKAYVQPSPSETNPDAYVLINTETAGTAIVLRFGSKSDIASLEEFAADLNKWAHPDRMA